MPRKALAKKSQWSLPGKLFKTMRVVLLIIALAAVVGILVMTVSWNGEETAASNELGNATSTSAERIPLHDAEATSASREVIGTGESNHRTPEQLSADLRDRIKHFALRFQNAAQIDYREHLALVQNALEGVGPMEVTTDDGAVRIAESEDGSVYIRSDTEQQRHYISIAVSPDAQAVLPHANAFRLNLSFEKIGKRNESYAAAGSIGFEFNDESAAAQFFSDRQAVGIDMLHKWEITTGLSTVFIEALYVSQESRGLVKTYYPKDSFPTADVIAGEPFMEIEHLLESLAVSEE